MNSDRDFELYVNRMHGDTKRAILDEFAEHIEICLQRQESLDPILSELHAQYLAGSVQEELTELFGKEPALADLSLAASWGDLEWILDQIRADERLTDTQLQEFETFWTRHEWIADGAEAFYRKQELGTKSWTAGEMDWFRCNGELYINHRLEWGVDSVHDIEAPLGMTWNEWTNRLETLLCRLERSDIDLSESDPELFEIITESFEAVSDQFEDFVETTEAGSNSDKK